MTRRWSINWKSLRHYRASHSTTVSTQFRGMSATLCAYFDLAIECTSSSHGIPEGASAVSCHQRHDVNKVEHASLSLENRNFTRQTNFTFSSSSSVVCLLSSVSRASDHHSSNLATRQCFVCRMQTADDSNATKSLVRVSMKWNSLLCSLAPLASGIMLPTMEWKES